MNRRQFIAAISKYISDNGLLCREKRYLVAFSGGADSTALLLILHELGYQVDAAHCNFLLRGAESDRDETFCRNLCREKGIELHIAHFDTKAYASLHKVSIEMAARDLRYKYFRDLCHDINAESICVAHHRDDNVETVLMNLIRGTGFHGLTGIRPRNGDIVRPLLCVSRQDIEQYLNEMGQSYVTDSTNLIDDVTRNKLRLDIIPLLKSINPSVCENISNTAGHMAEAMPLFDAALQASALRTACFDERLASCKVAIKKLLTEPSPEYTLFYILQKYNFSSSQVEYIYNNVSAETGCEWQSSTHQLLISRGEIIVEPIDKEPFKPFKVPEDGCYVTSCGTFNFRTLTSATDYKPLKERNMVSLDAARAKFPLSIRRVHPGDWFVPFGMTGRKLVSDYLTDRKVSLFEKRRQMAVCDADGNIVWLVNERPDNRFRITKDTSAVLEISFETQ